MTLSILSMLSSQLLKPGSMHSCPSQVPNTLMLLLSQTALATDALINTPPADEAWLFCEGCQSG